MEATKASYSTQAQIYSLSFIANTAFGLSMASLEDLQNYVTTVTTEVLASTLSQYNPTSYIGSDWKSVWGTVVYSNSPNNKSVVVDNAMGLFYSPSQKLFVVAIAGTNGNSTFDWLTENFDVRSTQLWQDVLGTGGAIVDVQFAGAAISTGAYTGFQILTSMQDAAGKTMVQALTAYLSANNINGATLAITGHSLAGALCSVLALYMYQIQENEALNWNANGAVTQVAAYPTASPTPGETNFADYYASVVAASNGAFTHTSLYNSCDVVPQAWMMSSMETVPGIYDTNGLPSPAAPWMGPLVLGMMAATVQLDGNIYTPIPYTQIEPRTVLAGKYSTEATTAAEVPIDNYLGSLPKSSLNNYEAQAKSVGGFLGQMLYQHTVAYTGSSYLSTGLLGIGGFIHDYGLIKKSALAAASAEVLQAQALAQVLGKYFPGITVVADAHTAQAD